ncbi:TonB-dependent receptor plug domain-containing protein [Pseudomaricurvus hydrocarbonicus]
MVAACVNSHVVQAEEVVQTFDSLAELSLEELLEIEVFTAANLFPTRVSKAPGTVYSFTAADFRRFGVRRVDELLQYVPGIQLNQHRKRHQSVWARGMVQRYNDKFVLLIDGVRQQQLYYGHFSLGDQYPLEQIEKVEVILGPVSSLYGAHAFSGLISIKTKELSASNQVTTSFELGTHDRQKVTALFNSPRVQGFASYLDQDAPFRKDRLSFIGGETFQPLDEEYQSLYLKAQLAPGLLAKVDYSHSETPFLFIPATQNAFVDSENWSVAVNYVTGELDRGRLEASAYYQQEEVREFERVNPGGALGYEEYQNATMAGTSLTGLKRWGNHTAALGASWRYEEAEETDYTRWFDFRQGLYASPLTGDLLSQPGIANEDFAVFIQDVWTINESLSLTAGIRYDDFEQFDSYVNYRVAVNYSPVGVHSWKLMYGTAIRTPTLREYLKVLENTTFVPPIPEAESIKSLELGYYLNTDRVKSAVTVYHNTLEDFIYEMPTPNNADEYFFNAKERFHLYGAEGLVDVAVADDLSIRLTAAYVDSSDLGAYSELPYIANWSGSVTTNYQLTPRHSLGLSLVFNSDRWDANGFTTDDSDGYVWANLYLNGELTPNLSYRLGVDNLLDEQVHDPAADFGGQYNTEKARRQVWLQFTWTPAL